MSDNYYISVTLNCRLQPLDRGDHFEDPLFDALEEAGLGEIDGGGTQMLANGEIDYCDIEVALTDLEKGIPFVIAELEKIGAPRGSRLRYSSDDGRKEVAFGKAEGLALYVNGTDLPDSVYQECNIDYVWEQIDERTSEATKVLSYWQGPEETALYIYGDSNAAAREVIEKLMGEYPLLEKSRLVDIA
ncbi:hypothetical protein [Cerasicoccus frondis]|uniref:hypothetical protein n=1 Tax=Cerasicoccus frondis TaxID=490090 RepID=UPI0028528E53|nr:hypothetical protein [Cerasicoccus frondis]